MASHKKSLSAKRRRRKQRLKDQDIARAVVAHGETTGEAKFDKPLGSPCPDCNLENRLRTTDLQPERIGRIPLRPARNKWRPVASRTCETCEGSGMIPHEQDERYDPYDLQRRESQISAEALRLWQIRNIVTR